MNHTKDDIQWVGDEEDEVQSKLKAECSDYVSIARDFRRKSADTRGPTAAEVKTAVATLENEMKTQERVDRIILEDVPPPEVLDQIDRPLIEAAEIDEPEFKITAGTTVCKVTCLRPSHLTIHILLRT